MEEEKLISLIRQYIAGTASKAELEELTAYISKDENEETVSSALEKVLAETGAKDTYDENRYDPLLKTILSADKIKRTAKKRNKVFQLYPLSRWAAAAAIVFMISAGVYFYFNDKTPLPQAQVDMPQKEHFKNDIAPGGNKAVLTLADGSQIVLDSIQNGTLTQQGNTKIIKLDSGQLSYRGSGSPLGDGGRGSEVLYNTISTPKGGQYQIVLADGSKVWLNSSSSIKFPVAFPGAERKIEIMGEAFFKVAKNSQQAFIVSVNGVEVQALGTEFNINAYTDEANMLTTLIEGSVKVSPVNSKKSVVIKPGQQASISHELQKSHEILVQTVDVAKVIAWQRGLFEFNKTDLPTIMRQISRWYDVDIVYEGPVTRETFGGGISRYLPLSNVLKLLEANGIKFRLEGKKLFVRS